MQAPTWLPALRNGTHILGAVHSAWEEQMVIPGQVATQAVPVMWEAKWPGQVIPATGVSCGMVTVLPALATAQHTGLVGSVHSAGSSHSQTVSLAHAVPAGMHAEGAPPAGVSQHTSVPALQYWFLPPSPTALNGQ
jgi:hypothetical protein